MSSSQLEDDPGLQSRWKTIEPQLQAAKATLIRSGGVYERRLGQGGSAWVVRFRGRSDGKRRHRAIYLGEEIFGDLARRLIRQWRAEAITPEQRQDVELLKITDLTASARGYSRRARRRLKAAALASFADPRAKLAFVYGLLYDDPLIKHGKPPGRPAKSGLW